MPAPQITIAEESLSKHPRLKRFLESSPPDVGLLSTDRHDTLYEGLKFTSAFYIDSTTLLEVLSLYGKVRHIEALPLSAAEKKAAVKARDYWAILYAAENGHLTTLQYLETHLTDAEKKAAVMAEKYLVIQESAYNGHLTTLQYLETHLTDAEKKAAVMAHNYSAIQDSAHNGHLTTLQYLETHLTDAEKKEAVMADNYLAIKYAAKNGHLTTLQYLETHLTDAEKKAAVMAWDYSAIQSAAESHHVATVHHFLRHAQALNYVEKHDYEYGAEFTYPYVGGVINTLKADKAGFEAAEPNGVFNVDDEQAKHCFYLLRNLIRRGGVRDGRVAERREEDVQFLLSIPAVCALCHQAVTVDEYLPGELNELLRLAIDNGNTAAAAILMRLPDVQHLAEENNYYQTEARGDMDLRRMAQNDESSMLGLSPNEQRLLETVQTHYDPILQEKGGIDAVMGEFKTWLQAQYEESPATISTPVADHPDTLEEIALPFEWHALQAWAARLTPEQYQDALKAYYAHDAHTAYRYLSKPNHWMHPEAIYVCVNPDNPDERWAEFEEDLIIIAPFYLAAFDENTPALEGHTLESRKGFFVEELALIGRAHNWDTRNQKGDEYDDMGADKPSCLSGVKGRLWQAVLGHPMFQQLTDTALQLELIGFTHRHFQQCITPENMEAVRGAFYRVIGYEEYETNDDSATNAPTEASDLALLSSLNIEEARLQALHDSLDKKYDGLLTRNSEFAAQFTSFFELNVKNQGLHVLLPLGDSIRLILEALKPPSEGYFKDDGSQEKSVGPGDAGFFASHQSEEGSSELKRSAEDLDALDRPGPKRLRHG